MTPPTMPPIAPPESPLEGDGEGNVWDSEDGVLDAETEAEADDGIEGVADEAPGVVEVMANSCWLLTENVVALGFAELRDEYVWLRLVELRKRMVFSCLLQQTRNCFAFNVHFSLSDVNVALKLLELLFTYSE
jgi:hypothetical protein